MDQIGSLNPDVSLDSLRSTGKRNQACLFFSFFCKTLKYQSVFKKNAALNCFSLIIIGFYLFQNKCIYFFGNKNFLIK